ncbi:Predicted kinase, aminoglycoside phosphotransferase (APT) family [Actinokineospora alba]|uniref:Predicted kinase, aminoglycoside phosphotransferase (APT) family n=1 Tax=Actinokineospora alba TaxID=504798 RepID=A0A1H0W430_9PSEU|nr:phosphotransferase family protein [Actinokineospora alba]TDP67818.1 aminoglycoside phosphotransferase (APT) family kinase protein [Actinokineospora alba]SDI72387.1 Predicted kinase, aminoglycoside phosphotransferase (APT) family [Actinokineospora alba]SDP85066.1 Predicted kinase, aminoglycoside phosphotransferase (APT) family [Actinokineospora alba]
MTVDETREVRAEDSFDTAAVHGWLSSIVDGLAGEPAVRQFPGGASNLTYLLTYPDRELILRRPPVGKKAASAHDMKREFRVQRALKPVYPYVPTVLGLCTDASVLGSDFYVMERIPGTILRGDLPEGMTLSESEARALSTKLIDRLVDLHQVDSAAAGLTDLGKGAGYVGRQVKGWSERFRNARTENVPDFVEVMSWLDANQPDDVSTVVIHNDWRFDNVVLDDNRDIVGVLDWEMSTLGDPLMDLGGLIAYWIQADDDDVFKMARRQPSHLPGMLTRAEIVGHYCDRMGLTPANWSWYEAFGLFRLAVIMQQIYYRYHHGQTHNPAFKDFWMFSGYLEWRCREVIGK